MSFIFNPSIQEAEAGASLWVKDQATTYQVLLGILCLKKQNKRKEGETIIYQRLKDARLREEVDTTKQLLCL